MEISGGCQPVSDSAAGFASARGPPWLGQGASPGHFPGHLPHENGAAKEANFDRATNAGPAQRSWF